jgi:hypothetical protein
MPTQGYLPRLNGPPEAATFVHEPDGSTTATLASGGRLENIDPAYIRPTAREAAACAIDPHGVLRLIALGFETAIRSRSSAE